jgi:SAM-dependent methyltransferase
MAGPAFTPTGPIRALAYRALWRCAGTFQQIANGFLYCSAGLLRREDLDAASIVRWEAFTRAVVEVDNGLEPWEKRAYARALSTADRVLIVGCGAGRDLVALRALGHCVTGLDLSPDITDLARRNLAARGIPADVHTGSVERAIPQGPFDVAIFSERCYGCMQGAAIRQAVLARLKESLAPRGRIVISYAVVDRPSPTATRLTSLAARIARTGWVPEPGDRFTRDHLTSRVLRYEHLFTPEQLASECRSAGFQIAHDERTNGVCRCLVASAVD